jgi:GH25 family lysozyme M1 (1,4-beta-N-acetylmuramidase)
LKRIKRYLTSLLSAILVLCLTAGLCVPAANAYTHDKQFSSGYVIYDGIDVSKWQGNIDWAKVKKAGVKFAFIRCGYTSTSSFTRYTDPTFTNNIKNAIKNGIQVGVYYFSQAKSTAEAKKEADYVLDLVKDYDLSLPIVFDEECESSSYRFQWSDFTKTQCTNIALAFCDQVAAAGYDACVYNSVSRFSGSGAKYDPQTILNKGYQLWVAHYGESANYSSYQVDGYTYWQYSDSGKVNGISGDVDMDYWYCKDKTATEECVEVADDTSITDLSVTSSKTVSITAGGQKQLSVNVSPNDSKDILMWTSSNSAVAYVDDSGLVTGVQSGTATITVSNTAGDVSASYNVKVSGTSPDEVVVLTYGDSQFNLKNKLSFTADSFGELSNGVLSVAEKGAVTIKGAGVTDVTAKVSSQVKAASVEPEEEELPVIDSTEELPADSDSSQEELPTEEETQDVPNTEEEPFETVDDLELVPQETADQPEPIAEEPKEPVESPEESEVEPTAAKTATETKTVRVVVERKSLAGATVELKGTSFSYTGKEITPKVSSVTLDGKTLPDTAYKLYANNNVNRGLASAVVVGVGNYTGVAESSGFYIRSNQSIYTPQTVYTVVLDGDSFYLKAKNLSEYGGSLTYKSGDKSIATVSSTGKITPKGLGGVDITITAAQNDRYKKTSVTVRVRVIPKKTTLSSVSAGSKKLTVKWKTTSGSGYQIQYSTSSSFKNAKTKKVSGKSKTSATLTGLTAKKKYYVRVRAYYSTKSGTTYGAWSSVKSATTKK